MENQFDRKFYLATLRTAHSVGMEVIPKDKAAKLMAILVAFGNNECLTLSPKFQCDCEYIQEVYHLRGGEVPDDVEFNMALSTYLHNYESVKSDDDYVFQDAAKMIKEMYNVKLYC